MLAGIETKWKGVLVLLVNGTWKRELFSMTVEKRLKIGRWRVVRSVCMRCNTFGVGDEGESLQGKGVDDVGRPWQLLCLLQREEIIWMVRSQQAATVVTRRGVVEKLDCEWIGICCVGHIQTHAGNERTPIDAGRRRTI